jgi:AcrR family transcriptional regulator
MKKPLAKALLKPAKGRPVNRAAAAKAPKVVSPKVESPKPASNRAERAAERREAIIEAAMDEFIARGFAATRLDDVAKRAGVAKGTIYLHFKDKESLFQELIRMAIVPLVNRLGAGPPSAGASIRDMIEGFASSFIREVATTARGEIRHKDLAKFPQILVAPALIAVIWQSLFARHAPLDAIEMFRVHLDLIFGERRTT